MLNIFKKYRNYFAIEKYMATFATFRPRTKNVFSDVVIFVPTAKVITGYCLRVGCCILKASTVLGRTNEDNSLFYTLIFNTK